MGGIARILGISPSPKLTESIKQLKPSTRKTRSNTPDIPLTFEEVTVMYGISDPNLKELLILGTVKAYKTSHQQPTAMFPMEEVKKLEAYLLEEHDYTKYKWKREGKEDKPKKNSRNDELGNSTIVPRECQLS